MFYSTHRDLEIEYVYEGCVTCPHPEIQDFVHFCIERLNLFKAKFVKLQFRIFESEEETGSFVHSDFTGIVNVSCIGDLSSLFTRISHELIHAEQWGFDVLRMLFRPSGPKTIRPVMLWNDEEFDHNGVEHQDLPWEQDAFERQDILVMEYRLVN